MVVILAVEPACDIALIGMSATNEVSGSFAPEECLSEQGLSEQCSFCDPVVCRCLQVTESTILEAAHRCPFSSLAEIARETGAGTGCMACHRQLRRLVS